MCLDKESDNNGTMVGGNVRKRSGFIKRAKGAAFSSECATNEEKESFGSNANLLFCPLGFYFSLYHSSRE